MTETSESSVHLDGGTTRGGDSCVAEVVGPQRSLRNGGDVVTLRLADLPLVIARADTLEPPTHLAVTSCRLHGIDPDLAVGSIRAGREAFQTLAEVLYLPGRVAMTMHIGVKGTPEDPAFESDFLVAGIGDSTIGNEAVAARAQVSEHLGGPHSPFALEFIPMEQLGWPTTGSAAFIRQQTVRVGDVEGGFELPMRFTSPGPDAGFRLLRTLAAAGPGTNLFVSATPTSLVIEEHEKLAGSLAGAEHAVETGVASRREVATAVDLSVSYRTDLYVLQVLVVSDEPLAEVTLRAIGSALTAPFDSERYPGARVVSAPNRFVGGGFDVEPCRDPETVLRWLAKGLPWFGFGPTRDLVDLVTSTELSYCLSWVNGPDGTLPGVSVAAATAPVVLPGEDTVELGTDATGQVVRVLGKDRNLHTAVLGATGSGKTTLLADLARQDIEAGRGVVVIDPHGDLCDRVLNGVLSRRHGDVHILDGRSGQFDRLNLLRIYAPGSEAQEFVNRALTEGITTDLNKDFAGPMFQRISSRLLRLATVSGGTVLDVERYLTDVDAANRDALASGLDDLIGFVEELNQLSSSYRSECGAWTSSKFEWLTSPGLRRTFASTESTFDLPTALQDSRIIMVYPGDSIASSGTAMSVFLSILLCCLGERDQSSPVVSIYMDEVQRYSGNVLRRMLNETRKRAVSLHLATQNLTNVTDQVEALLGNTGTFILGRCQGVTAGFGTQQLGLSNAAAGRLANFRAMARIPVNGAPCDPFELRIRPPTGPRTSGFPTWIDSGVASRGTWQRGNAAVRAGDVALSHR